MLAMVRDSSSTDFVAQIILDELNAHLSILGTVVASLCGRRKYNNYNKLLTSSDKVKD